MKREQRTSIQYEKGGDIDEMFSFIVEEIKKSTGFKNLDKTEVQRIIMNNYIKNNKLLKRFELYKRMRSFLG